MEKVILKANYSQELLVKTLTFNNYFKFFPGLQETKKTDRGVETISISREEQKKACDSITKQLRTFRAKVVCNVMGIPAARVPIVKFVHIKTGLSCDLRFFKALWKTLRVLGDAGCWNY